MDYTNTTRGTINLRKADKTPVSIGPGETANLADVADTAQFRAHKNMGNLIEASKAGEAKGPQGGTVPRRTAPALSGEIPVRE